MKSILITGVSGGIGSAIAKAFRKDGFYVFGIDITESYMPSCDRFLHLDLNKFCKNANYRVTQSEILDEYIKSLDVLVNNAAVQRLDNFGDIKLDDWQETMNVNLTAPMLLSKLFLQKLEKNNGCIINIGSIHQELTKPKFISYATSKSALIGLTKAMAVDLQGKIRVNAISPAAVETQMLLDGFSGDEKALNELKKIHPVQRIGKPEEIAALAIFLASENAGFINGVNIKIDGGISSVLKDL